MLRRIRVGIDAFAFVPAGNLGVGPGVVLVHTVRALAAADAQFEFVVIANGRNHELFRCIPGIRTVVSPLPTRPRLLRIIHEQFLLPWYALRDKLRVVHCFGNGVPLLLGRKTVLTVHDNMWRYYWRAAPQYVSWWKRAYLGLVAWLSYRSAGHLVAVSESVRSELVTEFQIPLSRVTAVPWAAKRHRLYGQARADERALGERYRAPYILTATTPWPHKNLIGLLRAFEILKRDPSVSERLVVAGQQSVRNREIEEFLQRSPVRGDVDRAGFVDDAELQWLYEHARVFVFPSLYEGFGLPVLEAMEAGTPVACSRVPALAEVGGDACEYFDPGDPEAIARTLLAVLRDESVRRRLIVRGRNRAREFSWERTALGMMALYRSMLGNSARAECGGEGTGAPADGMQ